MAFLHASSGIMSQIFILCQLMAHMSYKPEHIKDSFSFNPFSGILDEDLEEILVPKINIEELLDHIVAPSSRMIQFVGKHGRGKSTHLRYIHQLVPNIPFFSLHAHESTDPVMLEPSDILFIDSIHHLHLRQRLQLFRQKSLVIFTTHYSKWWECQLAGKELISYRFRGLSQLALEEIVQKRLDLASESSQPHVSLDADYLRKLHRKFGDNLRGILNHLYHEFQ